MGRAVARGRAIVVLAVEGIAGLVVGFEPDHVDDCNGQVDTGHVHGSQAEE